jgi:hypothetical protein
LRPRKTTAKQLGQVRKNEPTTSGIYEVPRYLARDFILSKQQTVNSKQQERYSPCRQMAGASLDESPTSLSTNCLAVCCLLFTVC